MLLDPELEQQHQNQKEQSLHPAFHPCIEHASHVLKHVPGLCLCFLEWSLQSLDFPEWKECLWFMSPLDHESLYTKKWDDSSRSWPPEMPTMWQWEQDDEPAQQWEEEAISCHSLILNHPAIKMPQERLFTLCSVEHPVGEHVCRTQEGDTP